MLLDNTDGTNMVPSTRKIFLEKFRRYIMDNCILDMVSDPNDGEIILRFLFPL